MSYEELVAGMEAHTGRKIVSREQAMAEWADLTGDHDPADFERACGEGSDTPVLIDGESVPDPVDVALGDLPSV